jgi:hypothetical protein
MQFLSGYLCFHFQLDNVEDVDCVFGFDLFQMRNSREEFAQDKQLVYMRMIALIGGTPANTYRYPSHSKSPTSFGQSFV